MYSEKQTGAPASRVASLGSDAGARHGASALPRFPAWIAALSPPRIALWGLVAAVVYLTLVPLVMVIYGTFTDGPPGTDASFTFANYIDAFGGEELYQSGLNSILFALASGALSFTVGCFLAWVTERSNAPLKPLIYFLVLVPFVLPGILSTISWIFLLSPTIGVLNQIVVATLGLAEPPFNIYTFSGMVWAFGIDHITLPFFLMAAAFRSMDPSLEEAATVSGMGPFRTFYYVNLRIMLPSIFAVCLLMFIRGIETFEAPAVIGLPAGINLFATEIFLALRRAPTNYNLAGTYAVAYLAITLIGVGLYLRVTRGAERFVMITGKAYRPRNIDLGPWRFAVTLTSLAILTIAVVLPLAVVVWTSFMPFYSTPSWGMLGLATLDNYAAIFELEEFYRASTNTLITGASAATIAVLLSLGIAWIGIRTDIPGKRLLDMIAFSPIAMPGVVLSLSLVWVYLTLPIHIYGTLWILIVAFVTKFIPISLRIMHVSLLQVHKELEEAAEIANPSPVRNALFVLLPLILPGMLVGWLYVLTLTFKDLSIPILLSHVGTDLLPVLIFGLFQSGELPRLCAMGVLLTLMIAAIAGSTRYLATRLSVKAGE
ncbi:MAG TPA: iron ABC transporter permease [Alphaproteobacteria bacterium]|nr:iron ABC transporter permease [Alphaproteobacteria bacterium]